MFENVIDFFNTMKGEFHMIPSKRKQELMELSQFIGNKYNENVTPQLTVICTHNSRRSHIGQLWLAIGADFFDLESIKSFSGGTEATAFNPRAVAAMKRIGLDIKASNLNDTNPAYQIKWNSTMDPYVAFSKKYNESPNPKAGFGAIMVCTDADENCPLVAGADYRISLPYEDPKAFDDTDQEEKMYDERCRQIGREILFCCNQLLK